MNGGARVAEVLRVHGVEYLFTLCGGHISPILVGCKARDIQVIDVRHEVDAVFAADAVARLTGRPGVAAVTAGPGVTNTITAIKNAQLAQSPVVLLGGATGTVLKGRGSLQDIDQLALFRPHVKWATTVSRVADLADTVSNALRVSISGVPGPVFVEVPVDLLYDEHLVRDLYGAQGSDDPQGWKARLLSRYLERHVSKLFAGVGDRPIEAQPWPEASVHPRVLTKIRATLDRAERPVLMVGSQATLGAPAIDQLATAVASLGVPVYLSGMARGLLGKGHPLHMRHRRRKALKQADVVVLAGVPCDFRLDYGRQISSRAQVIAINRDRVDLRKNRRPEIALLADAGEALRTLSTMGTANDRSAWIATLRSEDEEREVEIDAMANDPGDRAGVNPLELCRRIDAVLPEDSVLVADGGDFVATASYVTSPRRPLSWLDPGVFGTLGVGGGFALGARLCRPEAEVWILWGDGSAAYSLAEFDTFVRHSLPVIGVVGTDASWGQIARDQVGLLGDDVGTVLLRTDYHRVAEGYGGKGILIRSTDEIDDALAEAQREAAAGYPVLVNAMLSRSEFRKGSLSM